MGKDGSRELCSEGQLRSMLARLSVPPRRVKGLHRGTIGGISGSASLKTF